MSHNSKHHIHRSATLFKTIKPYNIKTTDRVKRKTLIISLQSIVLLGNLHVDTVWHVILINTAAEPLKATTLPDGSGPPSRKKHPATQQKLLQDGPRNITNSWRSWPIWQTLQISIQLRIHWTNQSKSNPWRPYFTTYRTQMIHCQQVGVKRDPQWDLHWLDLFRHILHTGLDQDLRNLKAWSISSSFYLGRS